MKSRPWLLGAVLGCWGVQVGLPLWGAMMGLLIEGSRWSRVRWELGTDDFRRLWNVTVLSFLGTAMYLFFANEGWGAMTELVREPTQAVAPLRSVSQGLLRLLQWMPILLFPFLLAHAVSGRDRLPWEAVSPFLRSRLRRAGAADRVTFSSGFHPGYPYLLLALFAASADYRHPVGFFPVLALLAAWTLWPFRSPRFGWVTWGITLGVALGAAYAGQRGLLAIYSRIERLQASWLNQYSQAEFDARAVRTDLEAVRRNKGSGRTVLRVEGLRGTPPPLLREACYTQFQSPFWYAGQRSFESVPVPMDEENWRLAEPRSPMEGASILRYSRQGRMALALPPGTFEVRGLQAAVLETNRLAAARIDGGPSLVTYEAWWAEGAGFQSAPEEADLEMNRLNPVDRQAIDRVTDSLNLRALEPVQVLQRVESFFLQGFEYSLESSPVQGGEKDDAGPLGRFLLQSQKGHCEFFATATTLLLRAGGVPARYVVGWSVQEQQGDTFVVRGRHAHAWSEAYVNGRWITVDNTPGTWSESDGANRSWWEPIYDRWSSVWLTFTRWRQSETRWRIYVLGLGLAVLSFMAWRELRGGRWRSAQRKRPAVVKALPVQGWDSEFYQVVAVLERWSAVRPGSTPLGVWIARLPIPHTEAQVRLRRMLRLHYRLRFDPLGLPLQQREVLRREATTWLQDFRGANQLPSK